MTGATIVEARELYKAYGAKVAAGGVSFEVRRGAIFGILGPNGAGKSTTLEMLEGLRDPDRGAAYIDGLDGRLAADRRALLPLECAMTRPQAGYPISE